MSGHLIYNCKQCGAVIRHAYPDIQKALSEAITGKLLHRTHGCSEAQIGVTELVGGEYDEIDSTK